MTNTRQQQLFHKCLRHQVIWVLLAILVNIYSLWSIHIGEKPLTSTEPFSAILLFLLFAPVIYAGNQGKVRLFALVTGLFVLLIVYGGIVRHLLALASLDKLEDYSSLTGLLVAVGINVYGVIASVWAIWCALKTVRKSSTSVAK